MKQEIVNKIHQTNFKRYGSVCPLKDPEVQKKRQATFIKNSKMCKICGNPTNHPQKTICDECKWSVCPICNKKFFDKDKSWRPRQFCSKKCELIGRPERIQSSFIEKYGVASPLSVPEIKAKAIKRTKDRYGVEHGFDIPGVRKRAFENSGHTVSKINKHWQEKIKTTLGIDFELEKEVGKFSYDLVYKDILIDINPWISHNSTHGYAFLTGRSNDDTPIPADYHLKRWLNAKRCGYRLLSYFDWYDEDGFIDIIRSKLNLCHNRVYARKTILQQIEQREANEFLEANHLQGKATGQSVCLGLFYNGDLVEVMTFGKPRMAKKWDWELIRLCTKKDWVVVGGKSKLLKHFLQAHEGSVFSYDNNDISCEDGEILKPMGIWLHTETGKTVNNNSVLRRGASRFVGDKDFSRYPKETPNDVIMETEGYVKIYNCGSTRQTIRQSSENRSE